LTLINKQKLSLRRELLFLRGDAGMRGCGFRFFEKKLGKKLPENKK
jgi:hypothetical protein